MKCNLDWWATVWVGFVYGVVAMGLYVAWLVRRLFPAEPPEEETR